jgi:short-subunit dehydrogenase
LELKGSNIHLSLIEPGPISSDFRKNAFVAYQKNIDSANSVHKNTYLAMEARLQKKGPAAPFTFPADAVVEKAGVPGENHRP